MTVIAAGVVTKSGRILVARCFTEVSRVRIEGLLSAFPKLLGSGSSQITFVDSGSVRYLYQPIETMHLVVVTTKASNIMEDIASLRLMGRAVSEYCPQADESSIVAKAFEIMFAMDEIITNGQRESTTMDQVVTALEMKSEAEEAAKREQMDKEKEAKKVAKAKAKELRAKRKEDMFNDDGAPSGRSSDASQPAAFTRFAEVATADPADARPQTKKLGGTGLSLSNKRKQDQAAKVLAETGAPLPEPSTRASAPAAASPVTSTEHAVNIKVEENIAVALNRDGAVTTVDISGSLTITVIDATAAQVRVVLGPLNSDFNFKTHPNVNRALFTSEGVLAIKDGRPYPTQQSLGILRWSTQSLGKTKIPLSVNAWPSEAGGTIEYELENTSLVLENVSIQLPLRGAFPTVHDISAGDYLHDSASSTLQWHIPVIDKRNTSGSLDVALDKAVGESAFFPAAVYFTLAQPLSGVTVRDVVHADTGSSVDFGTQIWAKTTDYVVN